MDGSPWAGDGPDLAGSSASATSPVRPFREWHAKGAFDAMTSDADR
jgi:hypothetical protein